MAARQTPAFVVDSVRFAGRGNSAVVVGVGAGERSILLRALVFDERAADSLVVKEIGSQAFLESTICCVFLSRNVELIGADCFSDCLSLASVSFETNSRLSRIGRNAFYDCPLKSLVIPRSTEVLGSCCFDFCGSLSSVSFESECLLETIKESAFSSSGLASIVIPRHVQTLCSSCLSSELLSSVVFEADSELSAIESFAFAYSSLKAITIPKSVTHIDGSAFANITQLLVTTESGGESFLVRADAVLSRDQTRVIRYFGSGTSATVPRSVQIICPDSFSYAESLTSIVFESDSQLKRIESNAFRYSSLASLQIPERVSFVDGSAFARLGSISIRIDRMNLSFVTEANFMMSSDRTQLVRYFGMDESVVVPRSVESVAASCFSCCSHILSVAYESGCRLRRLETKAFAYSSLRSIVLPSTVEVVASECFCACYSLQLIWCEPDSRLREVRWRAFCHCALSAVSLPQSIEILAVECFSDCKRLASVSFEPASQLKRIESGAFQSTGVRSVVLPGAVQFVAEDAFPSGCDITTDCFPIEMILPQP
jgi:hypothetical protein